MQLNTNYRRVGPRTQVCLVCHTRISTNALARAGHERGKKHQAALEEQMARKLQNSTVTNGRKARDKETENESQDQ
jgi:hypothetical protein